MKVILINSPLFRDRNERYDEDSLPPLGLGYIATNLRRNGIDVALIDAVDSRIPLKELSEILIEFRPDFIGLNIFTTNYDLVKELVETIRFRTHIVVGGLATRDLSEKIINWATPNHIDVVTGDGELIMLDIVRGIVADQPISIAAKRRVFVVDKDSKYIVNDISTVQVDRDFFRNEPVLHPLGFTEANIVTSRGCVYNCTFCAAARSLNMDYPVRERSEASIIAELEQIAISFPAG